MGLELIQFSWMFSVTVLFLVCIYLYSKKRNLEDELLEQREMHLSYVMDVNIAVNDHYDAISDKTNKLVALGNRVKELEAQVQELKDAKASLKT